MSMYIKDIDFYFKSDLKNNISILDNKKSQ